MTTAQEANNDLEWLKMSADRWRDYFELFVCEIDVTATLPAATSALIQRAGLAADQALEQEQERWGRATLDGLSK